MKHFIQSLPKAEIHIHIEGTLEPSMMLEFARKNNVKLPYSNINDVYKEYNFSNLQSFLNLYYKGMSVLKTEQDFYNLMYAYLSKAHQQNIKKTEIFFDPQGHTSRNITWHTFMNGFKKAIYMAKKTMGIEARLIMCFLRHLSEYEAIKTFEESLEYRDDIIGVGLDSTELGFPPSLFKNVFRMAESYGFNLVAHAGEEADHTYVWQAIDILGVKRIDHGNNAINDISLIKRLAVDKIPLTMCPLSNKRLHNLDGVKYHPLKEFMDNGVLVTINSDDPAYFGGYINENFEMLQQNLNLKEKEISEIANNAFKALFN